MVSNTSKKCLLALVLFSSLLAPAQLQCADGGKGSFWGKHGHEIAIGAGFMTAAAVVPYLVVRDHNMSKNLKETQEHLKEAQKRLEIANLPEVTITPKPAEIENKE